VQEVQEKIAELQPGLEARMADAPTNAEFREVDHFGVTSS